MSSTFLRLRYLAFALFISFSSVICIVAALNLGSLAPDTPRFPQVDSYLIVVGALGLVIVFPVIFVELIRKNAFIARVAAEVTWVGLLWVMHLSGAAAITAVSPQMFCFENGQRLEPGCTSTRVLLAFTWLSTLTLLSYLLALVVCAVHHNQEDSRVWTSGVRDYGWFTHRKSLRTPVQTSFSYGQLVEPKEVYRPPPAIYAQQIGLAPAYAVEPLRVESNIERPVPPVPAASFGHRLIPKDNGTRRAAPDPHPSTSNSLSLYPQHLQATVGALPAMPARASGPSPPPAGPWPRANPQEPFRWKQRPAPSDARSASSTVPAAPVSARAKPEMADADSQGATASGAVRSKPSGPRTPSARRHRPPPLDLSRLSSYAEPRQ